MRIYTVVCLIIAGLLSPCSLSAQVSKPKVVFILVDGIAADVIQQLDPPTLKEIAASGGFTPSIMGGPRNTPMQSPTISAVGYNSLITGTWVNKHNVFNNSIKNPNYNYWNIFRIAETIKPELHTAIFSTWTDNRTKLVGEGKPEAGAIKLDYAFDGLELDTGKFPHDKKALHIFKIDEAVSTEAARYIRETGPDLSWVYLEYTDDIGHRYGDSPEFVESVKLADIQIGRIWSAVKARMAEKNESWLVIVTTDHGRDAKTGKNHGGQSDRERASWIATNAKNLNPAFKFQPTMVDIAPSIAHFLNLDVPLPIRQEWDGVPFIGTVDLAGLQAYRTKSEVTFTWKCLNPTAKTVEIWVSTTNNYKTGDSDSFVKMATTDCGKENFTLNMQPSEFCKVSLRTPNQIINTWVVNKP